MNSLETFIILMFAAVLLVGLAQKLKLPYPIALVLGGTAIGFIPGLHSIQFDPDTLLIIVLPPVLYYSAFGISFREFMYNWRDIFSLALVLVAITTLIIGIFFKYLFPDLPWALAFAFGAIVSPPDATATSVILKRFDIQPRLLALLEGESLVNDASALLLYKFAIIALLSGSFSLSEVGIQFIQIVCGGILVGVVLGFLLQHFSRKFLEPVLGVVFSFTIPYITFISANFMHVSSVLSVVVNGIIGSRILLKHHSSLRRVLGFATWDIFIILLNCFVFILIGLQLREITYVLNLNQITLLIGYAFLITFVLNVVRMVWVYAKSGLSYLKARNQPQSSYARSQMFREATLIGWSGMRGIVSLIAALALPFTGANGLPMEGRDEVIFITFVVILLTLLIPSLTLSKLVDWLKIHEPPHRESEVNARQQLAKIAKAELHQLLISTFIDRRDYDFLKTYFFAQSKVHEMSHHEGHHLRNTELARRKVIQAQRNLLVQMWNMGKIDDKCLNHLEQELDMIDVHVARAELK